MSHAFFSPSSAPRVVDCPASLLLTKDMPDTRSPDAAHGTAAHWIGDLSLRGNHRVERYAGCRVVVAQNGECEFEHEHNHDAVAIDTVFGASMAFEVDDEMVNAVQEYVDWCNDASGDKYPECRVDISAWCPPITAETDGEELPDAAYEPQFGTSDHAACSPGKLVITDLKYGKGVKVFAKMNYQAVLYALGFIDERDWMYDFEDIEIRICQPRLDHKDVWYTTKAEIQEIGRYILERFTLALTAEAPFGPSEKACKFCKASGMCRAQRDYLSAIRAVAFDDLDAPDPKLLTNQEIVEAWRAHGLFIARFDAVERVMLAKLAGGEPMPGVKLVQSRTHRQWKNAAAARDELLFNDIPVEKIYKDPTIISPSQAEKLLPKATRGIVTTLAYKPRGGPCVVDAEDRRPDYEAAIAEEVNASFDDLDDPFA